MWLKQLRGRLFTNLRKVRVPHVQESQQGVSESPLSHKGATQSSSSDDVRWYLTYGYASIVQRLTNLSVYFDFRHNTHQYLMFFKAIRENLRSATFKTFKSTIAAQFAAASWCSYKKKATIKFTSVYLSRVGSLPFTRLCFHSGKKFGSR